jgi:hypothetical protein
MSRKSKDPYKTEYLRMVWYTNHRSVMFMSRLYKLFGEAIELDSGRSFDLERLKNNFNEDIKYLMLQKEYEELLPYADDKLSYDENGFHLDGHTFETLQEVRKALNNKAFL